MFPGCKRRTKWPSSRGPWYQCPRPGISQARMAATTGSLGRSDLRPLLSLQPFRRRRIVLPRIKVSAPDHRGFHPALAASSILIVSDLSATAKAFNSSLSPPAMPEQPLEATGNTCGRRAVYRRGSLHRPPRERRTSSRDGRPHTLRSLPRQLSCGPTANACVRRGVGGPMPHWPRESRLRREHCASDICASDLPDRRRLAGACLDWLDRPRSSTSSRDREWPRLESIIGSTATCKCRSAREPARLSPSRMNEGWSLRRPICLKMAADRLPSSSPMARFPAHAAGQRRSARCRRPVDLRATRHPAAAAGRIRPQGGRAT